MQQNLVGLTSANFHVVDVRSEAQNLVQWFKSRARRIASALEVPTPLDNNAARLKPSSLGPKRSLYILRAIRGSKERTSAGLHRQLNDQIRALVSKLRSRGLAPVDLVT